MTLSAFKNSDDAYTDMDAQKFLPRRSFKIIFKSFFFFLICKYFFLVSNASATSSPTPSFIQVSRMNFIASSKAKSGLGLEKRKSKAKILAFPSILFDSHLFDFKRLAQGLRTYGHKLTLYVSERRLVEEDSTDFEVRRYPGVFSTEEANEFLQTRISRILAKKPIILELFSLLNQYTLNCDKIFSNGRYSIEQLRKEKYDLIIVDPNELCGILLAKELGVAHVVYSTGLWVPFESNSPSPLSYVPEFNSLLTNQMNFFQRLYNTLFHGFSRVIQLYFIFPMYNRLIFKHQIGFENGKPTEYIHDIVAKTQSWLVSTDIALEFPRAIMPYTEFVGGISAHAAETLPQEFQVFAEKSSDVGGFILVSFGSGVQRLNVQLETIFSTVFSKLPFMVLWKYSAQFVNVSSNVKLVDWLPQNDLLGHPNLLLFIGHGGIHGVYECIYHGVPIVGIPLFGDQYDSLIRIQAKGAGISLDWKRLTIEKLQTSIKKVIENPKYKQAAEFLSQIHHDQPLTSLDRACRRIDYVIRYEGSKHLIPTVVDLNAIQYYALDVTLFLLLVFALTVWGIYGSIVFIHSKLIFAQDLTNNKQSYQALNRDNDEPNSANTNQTCLAWNRLAVLVMKSAANFVLSVCSHLRVIAVHPFYCGRCICGSRTLLTCLNKISRGILRLEFITKKNKHNYSAQKSTSEPKSKLLNSKVEEECVCDTMISATTKTEQPFIALTLQESRDTRKLSSLSPASLLIGVKAKCSNWVGVDGLSSTPSNLSDSGSFLELTNNVLTTDYRCSEAQYRLTQCNPSTRRSMLYQDCRTSHVNSYL